MNTAKSLLRGGNVRGSFARWVSNARLLSMVDGGVSKYPGNPVLAKGAIGQWDDFALRELSPVIDEVCKTSFSGDGLWGYYWGRPDAGDGAFQIGLAKSINNGVSWTRYANNPVVVPSGSGWMQEDVFQPSVVRKNDGTFVMMAAGRNAALTKSIGCLTSTDGLSWVDRGVKLQLSDFNDGGLTISEIGVPSLIKRSSGDWLCIVECLLGSVTNGWRVYGATATDPTGVWTPLNSGQPLMSPTGAGWESVGVANAHIIESSPGEYLIIYNGIQTIWQLGIATSTDLVTWTRHPDNPLVGPGASGEWDDQQIEACFLFKEPSSDVLRFYYQGYSAVDGSMQVGLATTSL